jgi:NAD(P)-dependent dehydrogenase (short-subunit alcohol dehydrogenase family)
MYRELFELKNYCSIVTGGTGGLGRNIALALAEFGSNIIIIDKNIEDSKILTGQIEKLGAQVMVLEGDITKRDDIKNMVDKIMDKFNRIDVLVNNAGTGRTKDVDSMDDNDWLDVFDVNLNGIFRMSQEVGKVMQKQQKGSIINISSISGLVVNYPQPQISYNTSKAGVIMFTKSLAYEWVKYNIRVNSIAPGYMNVGLTKKRFLTKDKITDTWASLTPMGRAGEPSELGGLVVFLASDASSYCTGGLFVADGGYTIW